MTTTALPWKANPPKEIPLANAPLVRVIAQARFPLIASMSRQEFIAPFQEAMRSEFPILRPEQIQGVVIGAQGVVHSAGQIWRFKEASGHWQMTIAPDFLALETTKYISRKDFMERLERALRALYVHVNPGVIDRLGIRYIDRIEGEDLLRSLPHLVKPQLSGVLSDSLSQHVVQTISESIFTFPTGAQLLARWGLVPAGVTVDPSAIEPIDRPSWLLDTDASFTLNQSFDVDSIVAKANELSQEIYGFFRWAVTDEFLTRYGGKL